MKKFNNHGFAISGVVYSILVLFVFFLAAILTVLASRKTVLDKGKKEALEKINGQNETITYTENDYVRNGLIVHYDGINNSGVGHQTGISFWKNLVSDDYNGVVQGGTVNWSDKGFVFDGTGKNYIKIGNDEKMYLFQNGSQNGLTIEVVFKYTDNKKYQTVLGNLEAGGYAIENNYDTNTNPNSGRNIFSFFPANASDYTYLRSANDNNVTMKVVENGTEKTVDQIYSISASVSPTGASMYENGEQFLISGNVPGLKDPLSNTIFVIGANPSGTIVNSGYFHGTVYSVRIYNRALTAAETYKNYAIDRNRFGIYDAHSGLE